MNFDGPALWSPALEDVRAQSVAMARVLRLCGGTSSGQPVRFYLRVALCARRARNIGRWQ